MMYRIFQTITSLDGLSGTKQILDAQGPEGVVKWIKDQKKLLLTDTTMRDAQQSLMATRVRTQDMKNIAKATAVTEMTYSHLKCGVELLLIQLIDS